MNVYKHIYRTFIAEIHKYRPRLICTRENVVGKQPPYPYVSLLIYNDEDKIGGSNNFSWFMTHIQMKAVSDNEDDSKGLGRWLRHLFYLQQPLKDLRSQGIIPLKNVNALPNVNSFIQNSFQFVSGADMTIGVNDPITDTTEPGKFDAIGAHFDTDGFYKKKGD